MPFITIVFNIPTTNVFQENVVLSLILTFFLGASGGACVGGFGLFVDIRLFVLLFVPQTM